MKALRDIANFPSPLIASSCHFILSHPSLKGQADRCVSVCELCSDTLLLQVSEMERVIVLRWECGPLMEDGIIQSVLL